jgi:Helix-turn-helix domain
MEKTERKSSESNSDLRLTYSPAEFAALFGRHQTWAYRQLYKGTVKAITRYGRIMIPRSEVDRLLNSAAEYGGARCPSAACSMSSS